MALAPLCMMDCTGGTEVHAWRAEEGLGQGGFGAPQGAWPVMCATAVAAWKCGLIHLLPQASLVMQRQEEQTRDAWAMVCESEHVHSAWAECSWHVRRGVRARTWWAQGHNEAHLCGAQFDRNILLQPRHPNPDSDSDLQRGSTVWVLLGLHFHTRAAKSGSS